MLDQKVWYEIWYDYKNHVVFDETEDKEQKIATCTYACEPKKYKYRCRFMKHKIRDACIKIVT